MVCKNEILSDGVNRSSRSGASIKACESARSRCLWSERHDTGVARALRYGRAGCRPSDGSSPLGSCPFASPLINAQNAANRDQTGACQEGGGLGCTVGSGSAPLVTKKRMRRPIESGNACVVEMMQCNRSGDLLLLHRQGTWFGLVGSRRNLDRIDYWGFIAAMHILQNCRVDAFR
jgi:hypothetical protein